MGHSLKGQGKVAFGIFVDGHELKFAHLSQRGKRIYLRDLKTIQLPKKLDETDKVEASFGEGHEIFSEPERAAGDVLLQQNRMDTNAGVILDLLSKYPAQKYLLAYSLADPSIFYHPLDGDPKSKNGQLKKKAIAEIEALRSETLHLDQLGIIPSHEKGALCVVREDGLSLIHLLEEIRPFLGRRLPRIPFIEPADIALMNLVRLDYEVGEDEISVVVYVGVEFSRIIFMKGEKHLHFAPLITEGADSPHIDNRLYSRILLEQDNLDVSQIHRVVLAGYAQKVRLKEFLTPRFPSSTVEYIRLTGVERIDPVLQTEELCVEYAVPIATAWRALDPKNKNFSPINLLPASLVERQKIFKLRWHGYFMLALVFLSTLFFTWNSLKLGVEVRQKTDLLSEKQHRLAETRALMESLQALQAKIDEHRRSLTLYDQLVPGSNQWTEAIKKVTNKIYELNGLWITNITSTPEGGMTINGIALYRNRIPLFASLYDRSTLRRVTVKEIRERKVYEFEVHVPKIR